MPKALSVDDIRMWQGLIRLWERKRITEHDGTVSRNWGIYKGKVLPIGFQDTATHPINVNKIHSIKRTERPSIFVRDPKIFIRAKKSRIATGSFDASGDEVILDGNKMARTLREAHNNHFGENKIKRQIERVRDDALIGKFGVMYVNYNAELGIDDEENPFIQNEQLINQWLPPDRFIYDPELDDFDLSYARWAGRIIDMPFDDVMENSDYYKNLKGLEDAVFISKELSSEDQQRAIASSAKKPVEDTEFEDFSYLKKVRLFELWVRPTLKERRDKGHPYRFGKVIVLAKDHDKEIRLDGWPEGEDELPFELLTFNRLNGSFMPLSDIEIYEPLAAEKNLLRTYQLQQAKVAGNFRIFYLRDMIDEDDIEKARKGENQYIGVKGTSLRDAFHSLTPGSVSAEYYSVDLKINRDLEEISGFPATRLGIAASGSQSATETSILDRNAGSVSTERLGSLVDFIRNVVKKNTKNMKRHFDKEQMLELTGLLEEDLEWVDGFGEKAIKDDVHVDIDVQSMIPISEAVLRAQALDILSKMIEMINSPPVMQKLSDEGVTLSLTEALKEFKDAFQIKNEDILQFLSLEEKQKLDERLALERGGGPGGPGAGRTGVPTEANTISGARRSGQIALQEA